MTQIVAENEEDQKNNLLPLQLSLDFSNNTLQSLCVLASLPLFLQNVSKVLVFSKQKTWFKDEAQI